MVSCSKILLTTFRSNSKRTSTKWSLGFHLKPLKSFNISDRSIFEWTWRNKRTLFIVIFVDLFKHISTSYALIIFSNGSCDFRSNNSNDNKRFYIIHWNKRKFILFIINNGIKLFWRIFDYSNNNFQNSYWLRDMGYKTWLTNIICNWNEDIETNFETHW